MIYTPTISTRLIAGLCLAGCMSLSAMAQSASGTGGASSHATSSTLTSPPSSVPLVDPVAAEKERRAATVRSELAPVSDEQARANAMKRCANLPPAYKTDCEARVRGEGSVSGSVLGGGMIKESVTTVTQEPPTQAEQIPSRASGMPSR